MLIYLFAYLFNFRITVGYGDILPVNRNEMILSVFTMIFTCGVFGYSLNVIGNIINDIFAIERKIDNNLHTINSYMFRKKIGKHL